MPDKNIVVNGLTIRIPSHQADRWDDSPLSLILRKDQPPTPTASNDLRRHYLNQHGQPRARVSKPVFDLGKLPHPDVRHVKHKENGIWTNSFDPKQPWFGDSVLLSYLTADHLIQRGIINLDPTSMDVSDQFKVDHKAIEQLRDGTKMFGNDNGIHPIFKWSNWIRTSTDTYEYLKPSLRIATKMLEMEVVLDFLGALGKPWVQETPTALHKAKGKCDQYTFYPKVLPPSERRFIASELLRMQDFVDFEWYEGDFRQSGQTERKHTTRPGWLPNVPVQGMQVYAGSTCARIGINSLWRPYLDENDPRLKPLVPGADPRAGLLRTQFNLAITLVHETVHAWDFNHRRDPPSDSTEAYCNDQRVAEPGWALEAAIFGSLISVMGGNPALFYGPFGLSSERWPGTRGDSGNFEAEPYKGTAAKWGMDRSTEYAVPMEFVRQFFTDDFWNDRVQRYGPGMVRSPKLLGARLKLHWLQQDYEAPESPRVKRRKFGNTWVDDPEPHSPSDDTLFPNVPEALLLGTEGKAYFLTGKEIDINTGKPINAMVRTPVAATNLPPQSPSAPGPASNAFVVRPTTALDRVKHDFKLRKRTARQKGHKLKRKGESLVHKFKGLFSPPKNP